MREAALPYPCGMATSELLLRIALVLGAVVAMEGVAWWVHRHVMHGWGWAWHRSHHAPRGGWFERNDLYAIVFAGIAILLIALGSHVPGVEPLRWIGAGMTLYGLLYFVVHDGMVHRRWPWHWVPRRGYLKRLYQAHRLHHALDLADDGVSFGFLWAPSPEKLKAQVQALRRSRQAPRAAA